MQLAREAVDRAMGALTPHVEVFTTEGLGDRSYLVAGGGQAVIVDPQRDVDRFLTASEASGAEVVTVLETHIHNDYVSGALQIRSATGAEVVGPASAGYRFPHRGVAEGDEVALEGFRFRVMETPGHTPEHVSYLLVEDGSRDATAVFTGGSLMVGGAGRTDLIEGRTQELTRAQFRSLRRLAALSGEVRVLPTHGGGSFCAAGAASHTSTSTIANEREGNPALRRTDEEEFVRAHLAGLLAVPTYYRHMAPINRAGPPLIGRPSAVAPLSPDEVARHQGTGAWVVDGRDRRSFAAAHVPGSVNVELDESFATYVGWVVPFGAPIVLVAPEPEDHAAAEAVTQLSRIGYDHAEGYLEGGVRSWESSGRPLRSYPVSEVDDLFRRPDRDGGIHVLDVRQPLEWQSGVIPGSATVFVEELGGGIGGVPRDREVWTICATGRRAAIAASLLDRAGIPVRPVVRGGVREWFERSERRR
jgi:hydroxyacylglutathione hydrolase